MLAVEEKTHLYALKTVQSDFPRETVGSSKDGVNFIRRFYSDDIEIFESMFLLLLNRANKTIGYAKLSQGGITGTVCDVKIVAKYCIDSLASSAIVAHNHPSGNLKPSEADKKMTAQLKSALKLIDCNLLDHVILTSSDFYSFADNGEL